jgi:hypothetical protein
MFVTVSIYRAKAGEDDAIIALHEDWQSRLRSRAKGYLSGELLRSVAEVHTFIAIQRFENQPSAHVTEADPEQIAWYQRLMSLTEGISTRTEYISEWQGS